MRAGSHLSLAFLLLLPCARGAVKPAPPAYVSAAALRADAAVGPNPFAWGTPGSTPVPSAPAAVPPSNVAHLALLRPYSITFDPRPAIVIEPANPFLEGDERGVPKLSIPKEEAADWYHAWPVTWTGTAWDALDMAWERNPAAVRKAFRDETKRDWPLEGTSVASELGRIAATRWVEGRWNKAATDRIAAWKSANGLRGPIIARGSLDSALFEGGAANHFGPTLVPRVTDNPSVNRYGIGFLLRLTADLGLRIPWPVLDLSGLSEADSGWGAPWLDEVVRNGVMGMDILPPKAAAARAALEAAARPLNGPNVYLPPPSEIGIFVSRDTLAREQGAWLSLFNAYVALREAGLWPNFVSDEQARNRMVSLARFNLLVVPAARWATTEDSSALLARAERGGIIVVTDMFAFRDHRNEFVGWKSAYPGPVQPGWPEYEPVIIVPAAGVKVLKAHADSRPAITERAVGDGAILASGMDILGPNPDWVSFWQEAARRAHVPNRPWLGAVTAANVEAVTGTYRKPAGP